jgi:hypothetical protein
MSEHIMNNVFMDGRLAPVSRPDVSILEMIPLVAALAVSFRWPGLTVPLGPLFLSQMPLARHGTRAPNAWTSNAMGRFPGVRCHAIQS